MENEKTTHPGYGLLSFSRTSSNKTKHLFGSSIPHNNTIVLRVHRAVLERSLSNDWHFPRQELIEVEMSPSQFAEAITTMNMGSGIPVTIRHVNMEDQGECPFDNKRLQFEREFKKTMDELRDELSRLVDESRDILNNKKKPISVADREFILKQIEHLERKISSSVPFIQQQFNEQMDKTVVETKGEIDAFWLHRVSTLGIQELKQLNATNSEE